ncbi:MAG: hypothetical protein V2G43_06850 [bacterium JZ-2024 1]
MVLGGGLWMGGQAWAFSGPEEKPADTSSRQVEGFYLGCRWIASPKDIPVPEKKIKEWENLLDRVKMIDKGRREFMIQLWTLTYQSEQFRIKASEAKRNRVILAGRRANKERGMNGRGLKDSGLVKAINSESWDLDGNAGNMQVLSGCQCIRCRFLVQDAGVHCFDDPNKYCLYCVGDDGQIREVGRFNTQVEWAAALQQQLTDCRCGRPGESAGDCGTFVHEASNLKVEDHRCCWYWGFPPWCDGRRIITEISCKTKCNEPPCPSQDERCVAYDPQTQQFSCTSGKVIYYDCTSCCDKCAPPTCGAPCDGTPTCTVPQLTTNLRAFPLCICVG